MFKFLKNIFTDYSQYLAKFDPYVFFPEAEEIIELLKKSEFKKFEERYFELESSKKAEILGLITDVDVEILSSWYKQNIGYLAKLFLGLKFVNMAWQARSGVLFHKLDDFQIEGFLDYLNKAREILLEAKALQPSDVFIYAQLIRIEMGQGVEREVIEDLFKQGYSFEPNNVMLLSCMVRALTPKWGGSREELLNFVSLYTNNSNLFGFKINALIEDLMDAELQDKEGDGYVKKVQRIKDYEDLFDGQIKEYIQQNPTLNHTNVLTYSNLALMYLEAGVPQKALEYAKFVGNNFKPGLWVYYGVQGPRDIIKMINQLN
jgi:hypothetical protein